MRITDRRGYQECSDREASELKKHGLTRSDCNNKVVKKIYLAPVFSSIISLLLSSRDLVGPQQVLFLRRGMIP